MLIYNPWLLDSLNHFNPLYLQSSLTVVRMQEKTAMLFLLLPLTRSDCTLAGRGASLKIKWLSLPGTPSLPSKSMRSPWPLFSNTGDLLLIDLSLTFESAFPDGRASRIEQSGSTLTSMSFCLSASRRYFFYQCHLTFEFAFADTRGDWLDKATGVPPGSIDSWFPLIWTLLLIVITRCILFPIFLW